MIKLLLLKLEYMLARKKNICLLLLLKHMMHDRNILNFVILVVKKYQERGWLIRDIWKSTNVKFQNRGGLATVPRKLKSSGVRSIISRAEWEQGIREPLPDGKKRHEFQAVHSMRKFFKSHCEQVMKSINVEILMGHTIGVSDCYYKPSEKEILEDYLKAINVLTIN